MTEVDVFFDSPVLKVKQPGKFLPTQARYEIFDGARNRLAVAAESSGRTRLELLKGALPGAPIPGSRTLTVSDGDDRPVLTVVKHADGRLTEVHDAAGELVGRIRAERTTRHYALTGPREEPAGSVVGDLALKNFTVTGPSGDKVARVTKTWAGLAKELLTPSDHYEVEYVGPVSELTRTLVAVFPIVLDLALYEPA